MRGIRADPNTPFVDTNEANTGRPVVAPPCQVGHADGVSRVAIRQAVGSTDEGGAEPRFTYCLLREAIPCSEETGESRTGLGTRRNGPTGESVNVRHRRDFPDRPAFIRLPGAMLADQKRQMDRSPPLIGLLGTRSDRRSSHRMRCGILPSRICPNQSGHASGPDWTLDHVSCGLGRTTGREMRWNPFRKRVGSAAPARPPKAESRQLGSRQNADDATAANRPKAQRQRLGSRPGTFLVVDLVWIGGLGVLAFGLASDWSWLKTLHDPFGGVVPFMVPWAGALGGVAISLVGVADHARNWDAGYAFWHLVRPVIGLIFGTVAVLIVVLVLDTVKATQNSTGGYSGSGVAVLAVISFVVGYREATFRTLVTRVVDVILGPGAVGGAATLALVPSAIDFKSVTPGTSGTATTHLFNGSSDTIQVSPGSVVVADPTVTVTPFTSQDLRPGGSLAIDLTWNPPARGRTTLDTTLVVTVANVSISAFLRGTSP